MADKILINPEGKVLVSNSGCSLCGMLKNKPGYQQGRSFVGYGVPAGVPCDQKDGARVTLFRWTVDYDTCIWYEDAPGARVWLTLENTGIVHVLGVEEIGTQLCPSGIRAVNALGMHLVPEVSSSLSSREQPGPRVMMSTSNCDACLRYKARTGWTSVTGTFRRTYEFGPHNPSCPDVTCAPSLVFTFTPQSPPGCVWYEESGYVRVWFGLSRGDMIPVMLGVEDLYCSTCSSCATQLSQLQAEVSQRGGRMIYGPGVYFMRDYVRGSDGIRFLSTYSLSDRPSVHRDGCYGVSTYLAAAEFNCEYRTDEGVTKHSFEYKVVHCDCSVEEHRLTVSQADGIPARESWLRFIQWETACDCVDMRAVITNNRDVFGVTALVNGSNWTYHKSSAGEADNIVVENPVTHQDMDTGMLRESAPPGMEGHHTIPWIDNETVMFVAPYTGDRHTYETVGLWHATPCQIMGRVEIWSPGFPLVSTWRPSQQFPSALGVWDTGTAIEFCAKLAPFTWRRQLNEYRYARLGRSATPFTQEQLDALADEYEAPGTDVGVPRAIAETWKDDDYYHAWVLRWGPRFSPATASFGMTEELQGIMCAIGVVAHAYEGSDFLGKEADTTPGRVISGTSFVATDRGMLALTFPGGEVTFHPETTFTMEACSEARPLELWCGVWPRTPCDPNDSASVRAANVYAVSGRVVELEDDVQ